MCLELIASGSFAAVFQASKRDFAVVEIRSRSLPIPNFSNNISMFRGPFSGYP